MACFNRDLWLADRPESPAQAAVGAGVVVIVVVVVVVVVVVAAAAAADEAEPDEECPSDPLPAYFSQIRSQPGWKSRPQGAPIPPIKDCEPRIRVLSDERWLILAAGLPRTGGPVVDESWDDQGWMCVFVVVVMRPTCPVEQLE